MNLTTYFQTAILPLQLVPCCYAHSSDLSYFKDFGLLSCDIVTTEKAVNELPQLRNPKTYLYRMFQKGYFKYIMYAGVEVMNKVPMNVGLQMCSESVMNKYDYRRLYKSNDN